MASLDDKIIKMNVIREKLDNFIEKNKILLIFLMAFSISYNGVLPNGEQARLPKTLFNVLIIISFLFMLLTYFVDKKKPSKLLLITFSYEIWIVLVTIFNNREDGLTGSAANMIKVLTIGLIIDYFSNDIKGLVKAMMPVFEILIYINFVSLFLYDISKNGSAYFLGYYNTLMLYVYPGILLASIYINEFKKFFRPILLIIMCILTIIFSKASTPLGSLLASIIVFIFTSILIKTKSKLTNHLLLVLFVFVVAFNVFILFFYNADDTVILKFIIEKILKRSTTFTGRTYIWKPAIEMFISKPICGYGFDTLVISETNFIAVHAHNEFLQVLVRCGLIGFAHFAIFIYLLIKSVDSRKNCILKVVVISLLFGIFLSYTTDSYLGQLFYIVYYLSYYYDYQR